MDTTNANGPRKKILSEEVNKQLLTITSQIDALRSDVRANQETIKNLSGNLQKGNNGGLFSRKRGESFKGDDQVQDNLMIEGGGGVTRKGGKEEMNPLFIGDIISMKLSEDGYVFGDIRMNHMGVESLAPGETRSGSSSANDAAFRLCPKLNYRTKREVGRAGNKGANDTDKVPLKDINK